MLALWVKVRIKPGERQRFLKAIEVDALGSERDDWSKQRSLLIPRDGCLCKYSHARPQLKA